ncbi:MAG TPA: DUF6596 domain-containing protein [Bryobacteraceae bacterium]|jgi:RNA polymerase sigma-70 factor (ECF subfamily)
MNEGAVRARSTAEQVARRSYGKLVAFLASRTRDVAAAEDALSEAFAAALADWPAKGVPSNPEAWLMTVARRKWIDADRRRERSGVVDQDLDQIAAVISAGPDGGQIPDRRLALMFACAHPAIDASVRAPLILQAIVGLDAATIASAFLTSPAAMSKRLVRAKTKIREAGIPLEVPERTELASRLEAVLEAIYAAYTEGWSDAIGADLLRRDLTGEALFLAGVVAELLPAEPEALGLLALMLHAEARRPARRGARGEYVPLAQQDMALWDAAMIAQAELLLQKASRLRAVGRYQLEAAVQSAHVARCQTGNANWEQVVAIYDALLAITASPVVGINRALAVAEVRGADAGLEALPSADADARLRDYQPYWAARAELLARSGASEEAHHAYDVALGLERDSAIREFLEKRRSGLGETKP